MEQQTQRSSGLSVSYGLVLLGFECHGDEEVHLQMFRGRVSSSRCDQEGEMFGGIDGFLLDLSELLLPSRSRSDVYLLYIDASLGHVVLRRVLGVRSRCARCVCRGWNGAKAVMAVRRGTRP